MKLTPNLIYEAALDDLLFAELPAIVAKAMDARSCVLHWRDQSDAAEISAHSGYFSDANMASYATDFANHDLWTEAGMGQGYINKGWRTTDLIPSAEYERSIFYNDWIRSIGDDTYYCCGSVMQTAHGHGIIGLHRGRTQSDFSEQVLHDLNDQVDHLRRMFTIRGRISKLEKRNDLLGAIFASERQAAFTVDAGGRIIIANEAGEAIIRAERFLRCRSSRLMPVADADRIGFETALAMAVGAQDRRASNCLLRAGDGSFVIASMLPLPAHHSSPVALITVDLPQAKIMPDRLTQYLQDAFALSPSEAMIAVHLADGSTIREISDQRRSAIGTVRTQVKNIMSKMEARRQSDVVRIVSVLRHGLPSGTRKGAR